MVSVVVVGLLCLVAVPVVECMGENNDLVDRLVRVEALLAAQDKRINRLQKENELLKAENDRPKQVDTQLSAGYDKLKEENIELRNSVAALTHNLLDTQKTLSKLLSVQAEDTSSVKADGTIQSDGKVTRADDTSPLEAAVNQLSQEVGEVKADIQVLQNEDQQHSQAIQHAATSAYTRWGHSACPASNTLVYSGVIGGSERTDSGAAGNALCLTLSPVLTTAHAATTYHAFLYGAEYQTEDSNNQKDPLCAVCRSPHPTTVMIPGTNRCTSGWTLEYSGYLMKGRDNHAAGSDFICVDSAMMSRQSSNQNDNGKLLYFTVTHCGSLPCDPYVNNRVVTCAVCSQ